jgi:glutaredoxin
VLRTVERLGEILPEARSQVMVIDPSRGLADDRVFVADLRSKDASGRYPVWVEKRGAWLDRNMPRHSVVEPLKFKPKVRRRRRGRRRAPTAVARSSPDAGTAAPAAPAGVPSPGGAPPPAAAGGPAPRVVMFSTSWCPSCKTARQYFARRGIAYADLDVEKDSNAARQYMAIQQRFRIKRGVVPLIIVNGRLFQGFSEPQIEAALKAPPPA